MFLNRCQLLFHSFFPLILWKKTFKICLARKLIRAKLYQNHGARKLVRAKISTNKVYHRGKLRKKIFNDFIFWPIKMPESPFVLKTRKAICNTVFSHVVKSENVRNTFPNMVCFFWSSSARSSVKKNWLPLSLAPAFAMATRPRLLNLRRWWNSS